MEGSIMVMAESIGASGADRCQGQATENLQLRVESIFRQAREDVFRYLLTLGLYPPQAQEAAQEVFLRLYIALRQGGDIRNERAWIFRVAHNLGLSLRAKEAALKPFDPDVEDSLTHPDRGPELSAIERDRMRRVNSAVRQLSPQQRHCLFLRAEGFSYREIAEALGVGIPTVGEFLRRAIARIRKLAHE